VNGGRRTSSPGPVGAGLRLSRWNVLIDAGSRGAALYNTLSLRGVAVPRELVATDAGGRLKALIARMPAARRAGLLVGDHLDEAAQMAAALRHPVLPPQRADVVYFAAPDGGVEADRAGLAALERDLDRGDASAAPMVKLRLCASARRPVAARVQLLEQVRAGCRARGLRAYTLWMTDDHTEVAAVPETAADGFLVAWRPGRADAAAERRAWEAIGARAGAGRVVAVHLLADGPIAPGRLRAAAARARALAGVAGEVFWEVARGTPAGRWFLPSVCETGGAAARELAAARAALTAGGVPIRPAEAPLHAHSGCPLLVPNARAYRWDGAVIQCLRPRTAGDPRAAHRARLEAQLAAGCLECALLPFCAAACPLRPVPAPGDARCRSRRRAIRTELIRLLASGQLTLERGPAAPRVS
jgi:hypothetical protein